MYRHGQSPVVVTFKVHDETGRSVLKSNNDLSLNEFAGECADIVPNYSVSRSFLDNAFTYTY